MIVVDTVVWADYFNGDDSLHVSRLDRALIDEEDVVVLPVIITEVLQGFRSERGFREASKILLSLPVVVPSLESHVEAARLFRRLRQKGISVRGAVDCIIAQTCIDHQAELLSPDADFQHISTHTTLKICRV